VEINLLDVHSHYHVPLVIAPGGYSTYRGAPPHRAPDDQGMWNVRAARAEEPAVSQVAPLPGTTGPGLTVHVIDVAQGCGAAGLRVEVIYIGEGWNTAPVLVCATNAEGRTHPWLVEPGALRAGTYELIFDTGDYFLAAGFPVGASQFFPRARVRVDVTDPRTHWHIPLIVSPWGYSCYRGS
jgi:5-hydroxyisourate hydrolase